MFISSSEIEINSISEQNIAPLQLTVFVLQTTQLDLVGLVLGLLLEPAGPGGQLVLLLPRFGSALEQNMISMKIKLTLNPDFN